MAPCNFDLQLTSVSESSDSAGWKNPSPGSSSELLPSSSCSWLTLPDPEGPSNMAGECTHIINVGISCAGFCVQCTKVTECICRGMTHDQHYT